MFQIRILFLHTELTFSEGGQKANTFTNKTLHNGGAVRKMKQGDVILTKGLLWPGSGGWEPPRWASPQRPHASQGPSGPNPVLSPADICSVCLTSLPSWHLHSEKRMMISTINGAVDVRWALHIHHVVLSSHWPCEVELLRLLLGKLKFRDVKQRVQNHTVL